MWTDKKTIRSLPSISKHPTVQKEQSCAVLGTATRKTWGQCGPHCKQKHHHWSIIIEVRSEKRSRWILQFQMNPRLKPWNYKKTPASLQRPLRSDGPHSLTKKVVTQPQKKKPISTLFHIHVHTRFFFSYSGGTHEHQNEKKKVDTGHVYSC